MNRGKRCTTLDANKETQNKKACLVSEKMKKQKETLDTVVLRKEQVRAALEYLKECDAPLNDLIDDDAAVEEAMDYGTRTLEEKPLLFFSVVEDTLKCSLDECFQVQSHATYYNASDLSIFYCDFCYDQLDEAEERDIAFIEHRALVPAMRKAIKRLL